MTFTAESWSIFDGFAPPGPSLVLSWAAVDEMEAAARLVLRPALVHALDLCGAWRERLTELGDSPSDRDWSGFRLLRLSREEDWSNWLAFLLEAGPPLLIRDFLGLPNGEVRARREVRAGDHRADIVLMIDGHPASIEVKIDDLGLGKTFDCCAALETSNPGDWLHFILIPDYHEDDWQEVARARADRPKVARWTWTGFALCLRRCLWRSEGSVAWRCWAVAFCGAVEQLILGLPAVGQLDEAGQLSALDGAIRLGIYLTQGMGDGDASNSR